METHLYASHEGVTKLVRGIASSIALVLDKLRYLLVSVAPEYGILLSCLIDAMYLVGPMRRRVLEVLAQHRLAVLP
jgi:phage-related protein